MQHLYILLAFLLITVALLIVVIIYCYLIKYRAIQKYLLPLQVTNKNQTNSNKVKDIDMKNHIYYFFDDIIYIKILIWIIFK